MQLSQCCVMVQLTSPNCKLASPVCRPQQSTLLRSGRCLCPCCAAPAPPVAWHGPQHRHALIAHPPLCPRKQQDLRLHTCSSACQTGSRCANVCMRCILHKNRPKQGAHDKFSDQRLLGRTYAQACAGRAACMVLTDEGKGVRAATAGAEHSVLRFRLLRVCTRIRSGSSLLGRHLSCRPPAEHVIELQDKGC